MMIDRSLPNDEYQAAINASNPSATNPFITENDLAGGLGGSVNMALTSVLDNGTANSGIILDQNILTYTIEGLGGPVVPGNKVAYFQFIVPAGYSGDGSLDIVLSTLTTITNFVITARINGNVIDSTINGTDLNTAVTYPTFEKQTLVFGTTLVPGDIVTLDIAFSGENGMDVWFRGLDFNYNIEIL